MSGVCVKEREMYDSCEKSLGPVCLFSVSVNKLHLESVKPFQVSCG